MVLKKLEDKLGLPPIKEIAQIASGPGGKQVNSILGHLEKITANPEVIREARDLLILVQQMDDKGTLGRLLEVLTMLPKGKQGSDMMAGLKELLSEILPRLDKLQAVVEALMEEPKR